MPPSYTPAGHCRKCGYPIDPGLCPECGTVCTDVGPRRGAWGRPLAIVACVGLLPIPWAIATNHLSRFFYSRMTAGLIPGDTRFNVVWTSVNKYAEASYFMVLPLLLIVLALALASAEGKRQRNWNIFLASMLLALSLGAVSWFLGFFGLIATLWNE